MRQTYEETEALKLLIIKKAREIFISKGYAKTKMQDIADAANISRGPLYYHNANKLELFNKVVDIDCAAMYEDISEIFKRNDITFLEKIHMDLQYCISQERIAFDMMFAKTIEGESQFEPAKQKMTDCLSRLYALKLAAASKAVEMGELRPDVNLSELVSTIYACYGVFTHRNNESLIYGFGTDSRHLHDDRLLEFIISSIKREYFN